MKIQQSGIAAFTVWLYYYVKTLFLMTCNSQKKVNYVHRNNVYNKKNNISFFKEEVSHKKLLIIALAKMHTYKNNNEKNVDTR